MADLEKKLADFSKVILSEAQEQKHELMTELEKRKNEAVKENENEILEYAYEKIQKAVSKHSKEQNERILKHEMDAKKQALKKREDIMNSVFSEIEARLNAFVSSPEYEAWLVSLAKKACDEIGYGEIKLCERDLKYKDALKNALPDCEITAQSSDMIGGLTAKCGSLAVNYSLRDIMEEKRSGFLKISGLNIKV